VAMLVAMLVAKVDLLLNNNEKNAFKMKSLKKMNETAILLSTSSLINKISGSFGVQKNNILDKISMLNLMTTKESLMDIMEKILDMSTKVLEDKIGVKTINKIFSTIFHSKSTSNIVMSMHPMNEIKCKGKQEVEVPVTIDKMKNSKISAKIILKFLKEEAPFKIII
jgi:predicted RNA-binding protein with EMAP domain